MQLQRLFLVLCAIAACQLPASAQQAGGSNPLNDLLTIQMNWDALKSDDNAKPSIPLRFVPFEKHKQDGKSFTSYYVYASGLPSDHPYTLITWQIGWDAQQPPMQQAQSDLYINARGVVMCRKPTPREANSDAPQLDCEARLELISAGSKGEPVRYALYSEQQGVVAMGRLIVNPIESEDKGCHLQAILGVGGAEVVLVEGTGFAPKSSIELSSGDSGKPQTATFKTDASGRLETAVVLVRASQTHGTAAISAKSDSCAPAITFDWGRETYKVQ